MRKGSLWTTFSYRIYCLFLSLWYMMAGIAITLQKMARMTFFLGLLNSFQKYVFPSFFSLVLSSYLYTVQLPWVRELDFHGFSNSMGTIQQDTLKSVVAIDRQCEFLIFNSLCVFGFFYLRTKKNPSKRVSFACQPYDTCSTKLLFWFLI